MNSATQKRPRKVPKESRARKQTKWERPGVVPLRNESLVKPNLRVFPNVLPDELHRQAHQLFFSDQVITYLQPHENRVRQPFTGKMVQVPREQAVYSTPGGLSYAFSGARLVAREEKEVPLLTTLREWVEKVSGNAFNFAFINYYATGKNTIGWHSDDEDDMVSGAPIASLTLGAARDFDFRLIADYKVVHRIVLEDNMLVLMDAPTNQRWEHALPRRMRLKDPRINITFRLFKPQHRQ